MGQSCNKEGLCVCVCSLLKGMCFVLGVETRVFVAFPTAKVIKKSSFARVCLCVLLKLELIISAKGTKKGVVS